MECDTRSRGRTKRGGIPRPDIDWNRHRGELLTTDGIESQDNQHNGWVTAAEQIDNNTVKITVTGRGIAAQASESW